MRKGLIVTVALLAALSAGAEPINLTQYAVVRNYYVSINISDPHEPSYDGWYSQQANYTLNWSRIPKMLQGAQPSFTKPNDLLYDRPRSETPVLLDPRTCPNQLAFCYQILSHEQNRSTWGKNYSPVSSYILPQLRMRTFVCPSTDKDCWSDATNCYCPKGRVPQPPIISGYARDCSEYLCMRPDRSFVVCTGERSGCGAQFESCVCTPTNACAPELQTCIDERRQFTLCRGTLANCAKNYQYCFCGRELMELQTGCTTTSHACEKDGKISVCQGTLSECALKYNKCDC